MSANVKLLGFVPLALLLFCDKEACQSQSLLNRQTNSKTLYVFLALGAQAVVPMLHCKQGRHMQWPTTNSM